MKKHIISILLLCLFFYHSTAQVSKALNSSDIFLGLQKLNTVGSVLYIAAHPDDENTRLLAWLANEKKLRTGYLSLTRGDGGQNLIGKEQGELLGLIRTQELLAARRTDGAEQFFTRANDFGYSKNPEETFRIWNKDSILYDVVLTIRKFRPDVIICRFPTTGEGGHGHHTASAILALEAFDAAADPGKFSDQLKYTQVWQAKRIFWNTFNFGGTNTTAPNQLKTDVGVYNALLGKSYGEIAAESRSMHKSQGFGAARQRGSSVEYFKILKGDSARNDLYEGISSAWSKFKGTEKLSVMLEGCISNYHAQSPENSLKELISVYRELQVLDENNGELVYWKKQKLKETENLILACSGLWLEAQAADNSGIPGQETGITAQLVNRNKTKVKLNGIRFLNSGDTITALALEQNVFYIFKHREKIPASTPWSNPYWLNQKHSEGLYTVSERSLIGQPENDAATKILFDLTIEDLDLKIERNLVYKFTDPVKGEIYRPFEVLPPLTINIPEKVFVFSDKKPRKVQITVKANLANVNGILKIKSSEGWHITIKDPQIRLKTKGEESSVEIIISADAGAPQGLLEAAVTLDSNSYNKTIKRIEYDHIPYQFILKDAEAGLVYVDLKKSGTEIAYIPGAGDEVAACLKQVGYNVTQLTDEMISKDDLGKYKAIVTGIRAYNINEHLQGQYNKLMDYVKNGGNLVVQYNTNSRAGPLQARMGPYPFTISRERVTDATAEVKFINVKHPVLNFPNKISSKDFDRWIQERGIYFASDIDKQYQTVFEMNDPGEKPNAGSLITARYGKGNFVYTGLVFFRELPAGVPGAYRLFVNLLSLQKH